MKASFVISLALSAAAMAAPAKAPQNFALSVTAKVNGSQKTFYLANPVTGKASEKVSEAVRCHIDEKTELVCGGQTLGLPTSGGDMFALKKTVGNDVTSGVSIDNNNVIHWTNKRFTQLRMQNMSGMKMEPGQKMEPEIRFAIDHEAGQTLIYALTSCPENLHHPMGNIAEGIARAVAE